MRPNRITAALLFASLSLHAQTTAPKDLGPDGSKPDAVVHEEWVRTHQLMQEYKNLEALPMAEDLVKQRPRNPAYHETLGMALLSTASLNTKTPKEKSAQMERARKELRIARSLGDDSNLLQIVLEKMGNGPFVTELEAKDATPAMKSFNEAENQFHLGKIAEATTFYAKAFELDPALYEAALYAGDMQYRLNKFNEANAWYGKAVAVDPNRETAYRYWGDSLAKDGKRLEARDKFIDGVIASPYGKSSWVGLKQWAEANKVVMGSPQIQLPAGPTQGKPGKDGKQNINITLSLPGKDDKGSAAWMMYSMERAIWLEDDARIKKAPALKTYRHSLAEETSAIRASLSVVKGTKISSRDLDNNLRQLADLDKDGMLESWILLNNADNGIAQDYRDYRETHRPQLRAYIEKYVLHAK